jgi:hypothetical protein
MLTTRIHRIQHAVGHGGFHAGHIDVLASLPADYEVNSFHYVYDCGSESGEALKHALNSHRSTSNGRTDILFVSHLHSDHINGIERLQALAPVTTAVVPYLDIFDRLIFFLADMDSGSASSSAREYLANPARWWLNRGTKNVFFIEADNGDTPRPIAPEEPDGPIDDGGRRPRIEHMEKIPGARLAPYLRKPRESAPSGLKIANEAQPLLNDGAILAGAGSFFQLQWRSESRSAWRDGDWILLPYVHPVEQIIRSHFQRAVRRALGLTRGHEIIIARALLDHLTHPDKTEILLELYNEHFGRGHNALSMSLYSGPYCVHSDRNHQWRSSSGTYSAYSRERSAGWLGTGDSALKQQKRRDPWLNHFTPYTSHVGVLTLPHHGSAHNYHDGILAFDGLAMALATTIERRNRVAGLRDTLDAVQSKGIQTHIVDDQRGNTYQHWCERDMDE